MHFTYTDLHHDPYIATAYAAKIPPTLFVLDFGTKKAYQWEIKRNLTTEFANWVNSGDYKKAKV